MAKKNDEHQPVMVKATYADGTVYFYDSALHAHATHFDGSPVVSIVRAADDEAERVEQGGAAPEPSDLTGQQVAYSASVATEEESAALEAAALEAAAVSDKDAAYLRRIDELERQLKVGAHAETSAV